MSVDEAKHSDYCGGEGVSKDYWLVLSECVGVDGGDGDSVSVQISKAQPVSKHLAIDTYLPVVNV